MAKVRKIFDICKFFTQYFSIDLFFLQIYKYLFKITNYFLENNEHKNTINI